MVTQSQIREFSRRIGREFGAQRVVLFGSHAYGTPTPDSDVDLLVVMPLAGKGWRKAAEIRTRLHPAFPCDIVVRSPEQIEARLELGDCFVREIMEKGKVLYESAHA